jgi:hypothetical protein
MAPWGGNQYPLPAPSGQRAASVGRHSRQQSLQCNQCLSAMMSPSSPGAVHIASGGSAYLHVEPHGVWGMRRVFVWCGVGPARAREDSASRSDSPGVEGRTILGISWKYNKNHRDFPAGRELEGAQGQCMCPQGIPADTHRLPLRRPLSTTK